MQIKISSQLLEQITKLLTQHDSACQDHLVSSQYLIAMAAYLVAGLSVSSQEKQEIISQLSEFFDYVYQDLTREVPPQQSAFGIWEPEK